jgi:hypothetical protein
MKSAELAQQLWQRLWQEYRQRVPYARIYEQMIAAAGGTIANDHIAFRTLRMTIQQQGYRMQLGIPYLAKLVEALGYEAAGDYHFPAQSLYARHYCHPEQATYDLPKLFISELIVEALPDPMAALIQESVQGGDFPGLPLATIATQTASAEPQALLPQLANIFQRPWSPPLQSAVERVNSVSQYGAWVMLHGYAVNHFTGYVNRHHTETYRTIAQTVAGLVQLGVPMKTQMEGGIESGLCQTATQAVTEPVWVQDDATAALIQIPWSYAYYEIAERYQQQNSSGMPVLFEGFLPAQAQQLFEMTKTRSHEP